MRKEKRTLCFLILSLLIITTGVAWYFGMLHVSAYVSAYSKKNNTVKVGDNTSHIEEEFEPPETVSPDTKYEKRVSVVNDTDTPCYVRVFIEKDQSDLPVSISFDTENWTRKQEDGYYYYRTVLKGKEKTKPLIAGVTTGKTEKSFRIIVYEETVQAHGCNTAQEAFASIGGEQEREK